MRAGTLGSLVSGLLGVPAAAIGSRLLRIVGLREISTDEGERSRRVIGLGTYELTISSEDPEGAALGFAIAHFAGGGAWHRGIIETHASVEWSTEVRVTRVDLVRIEGHSGDSRVIILDVEFLMNIASASGNGEGTISSVAAGLGVMRESAADALEDPPPAFVGADPATLPAEAE